MSAIFSPPPSPPSYKRHRRSDSFLLVQEIIKEQEKQNLKSNLIRYSCPTVVNKENDSKDVIPRKSKSNHSVTFTNEPPTVFHYI